MSESFLRIEIEGELIRMAEDPAEFIREEIASYLEVIDPTPLKQGNLVIEFRSE